MYTYGRKQGCRLSLDYTYKGMRVAFLENELIRVGVLLDKGADIFEFTYKPHDIDFLWQSPIPMRSPFVATSALAEGNFHDYYYGGWQEVLPSAAGLLRLIKALTKACMEKFPYCPLRARLSKIARSKSYSKLMYASIVLPSG